jgi:sulfur carrier protein ThiS
MRGCQALFHSAVLLTADCSLFFDLTVLLCYLIAMKVEWDGNVYELGKRLSAGQLLSRFSLSPEAHLVMANERLVTEDYRFSEEENVKIIRVISGG